MKETEWVEVVIAVLWGGFGFLTGLAYARNNGPVFLLGVGVVFLLPIGWAVKRLIDQTMWRREWERRYKRKWRDSEAANMKDHGGG